MADTIIKICTTKLVILKWCQMICCLIIVLFLIDGRLQWIPYTTIFVTMVVLGILSFLTMMVYFFQIHRYREGEWTKFELAFNFAAAAFCLVYSMILIYDIIQMHSNHFSHHRYFPPENIGRVGWKNRILVVAIVQMINTVFFGTSFVRTYLRKHK